MTPAQACPCGAGSDYRRCCGPLHTRGAGLGTTAVDLMRARYAAYVAGNERFLLESWHPDTRPPAVRFDPEVSWIDVTILDEVAGGALDESGVVDFAARFMLGNEQRVLRERSTFRRVDGRWFYVAPE